MRIVFIIAMLAYSYCMQGQNTVRGKVATHMALVRTYLATGDTVSALKEYHIIAEITPNDENVKRRIAELSATQNRLAKDTTQTSSVIKEVPEPLPIEKEEVASVPLKEETAAENELEEKIANNDSDFNKFGGFSNYKKRQATNNENKKTVDNKPKQTAVLKPVYEQNEDILAKAFAKHPQNDNNLFKFTNLPYSPLHSLLDAGKKNDNIPDLSGRWISSFRSNNIYSGTMFTFSIDSLSNKLEFINDQSQLRQICESNGYIMEAKQHELSQGKVTTDFSISYDAPNYNKVKDFIDKLLKPFFNEYAINNTEALELMTKGVLKHDTLINETVKYDTIMVQKDKKIEPEIIETVLRDTTVNSYYKLDPLFKVRCNISFNSEYSKNILYGSCLLDVFIDREDGNIPIAKTTLPCCFYKVDNNYNDDYVFAASEDTYSIGNEKNEYAVDINGVDMKNVFEKLASGREKNSIDAFNASADLMMSAPCGDLEQAYKWFSKSADKKNAYALLRLGQMKLKGQGCSKDVEGAISLFEESLINENYDAGYELALVYLEQNSLSKAYSKAIENASNGSVKAMKLVSEMYFTGIAVRPNASKALSWLKRMQKTMSQQNNK